MPKSTLNRTANNIKDFSVWVAGQMRVNDMTQKEVATYLNIDQPALSMRIHGKTGWKLREVFELYQLFGEEYSYKG